jgi:hypothetical protein
MNHILNFSNFHLHESKSEKSEFDAVTEDIKNILNMNFSPATNIFYKVNGEFLDYSKYLATKIIPTAIQFNVTEQDFKYTDSKEELRNEYSVSVLSKRANDVGLVPTDKFFKDNKFFMEYDVVLYDIDFSRAVKYSEDDEDDEEIFNGKYADDENDGEGLKGVF